MPNSTQDFDAHRLALATEAYFWGYPRMQYAKYLRDLQKIDAPLNRFFAMDRMSTPNHGAVNVDTLYGLAWLDVGPEPVVLDIPDAHDRYYSIQMIDVHANNFAYIGRRTTGTKAGRFLVAGPGWQGDVPAGMSLVRSPSRGIFCFLRTLIDDEADVLIANEFDRGLAVAPLSAYPQGLLGTLLLEDIKPYFPHAHTHLDKLGAHFFDHLGDALAADPPTRPEDIELMGRFAEIGVGPGQHPSIAHPSLLAEAVRRGHEQIFAATSSTATDGWSVNMRIDDASANPLFKATLNRFGIGMLGPEEAIYLLPAPLSLPPGAPVPGWTCYGPDGTALTGAKRYRLNFPSGKLPPVDAFWSLTMYDEKQFLVRNPIDRYAIGDRTRGLVHGEDGSLEILIQAECPASGPSNWLPAPAGEFHLFFRAYQPRPAFIDGSYRLPPLEILP